VNDEPERMREEAAVAEFKVLSRHLLHRRRIRFRSLRSLISKYTANITITLLQVCVRTSTAEQLCKFVYETNVNIVQ
jgi:hypothetical protein